MQYVQNVRGVASEVIPRHHGGKMMKILRMQVTSLCAKKHTYCMIHQSWVSLWGQDETKRLGNIFIKTDYCVRHFLTFQPFVTPH